MQIATEKNEFLRAGNPLERLEAEQADFIAKQILLEWGIAEIQGLRLNNRKADVGSLLRFAPMELCDEAISMVRSELELSEVERKNF